MQALCIGVNELAGDIVPYIKNELEQYDIHKKKYSIDEVNSNGSTSIICKVKNDGIIGTKSTKLYNSLRIHISNALADYIINKYEEKLIERIINCNYCYFNALEKKEVIKFAMRIIRNEDKSFLNSLFQIRRRNIIIRKLLDYFEGSDNIILDGFVNFRLKDYIIDLEEIVDKAVDDFLMDKEYKEFIKLLTYFVEIQEPKFDVVHVITRKDNRYTLMDQDFNEITNQCIKEFINDISVNDINYDDLLVSSLITLAPRNIVIHGSIPIKNKELLKTIKNVFYGRIAMCTSCEMCQREIMEKESQ